jgi:uncharacterized protein (TIGR03435 family)
MRLTGTIMLSVIAGAALAQVKMPAQAPAPAPHPEFEVASIRASADAGVNKVNLGLHIDGSQVRCVAWTLRDYAGMAYKMKATLIFGPDWTGTDRFDISATFPAGTKDNQMPEMFQSLLADRFQLKFHREKREFPVYALLQGKPSPRLKESPADNPSEADDAKGTVNVAASGSAAGVGVSLGNGSAYSLANNKFEVKKLTMDDFARNLERFSDRQIIDMTGLKGHYDFTLDLTPDDYRAMLMRAAISAGMQLPPEAHRFLEGNSSAALGDALQQVGLRLEARKMPIDVIVIDSALKSPTGN